MNVTAVKTKKIIAGRNTLTEVLSASLSSLANGSILAVTSKIVSLCEGRAVKIGTVGKIALIQAEADYYLSHIKSRYGISLTRKNDILIPSAGIDESNGNGYYVLWPRDPQKSANAIRAYLRKHFSLSKVGVIITDSRTTPLRWGTSGVAIAWSGFSALKNYIGKPDVFGKKLRVTKANMADALAAAAVVTMGEGKEQTPLAIIKDVPFVAFQNRNPSLRELRSLRIKPSNDLYAPLLTAVRWKKGGGCS